MATIGEKIQFIKNYANAAQEGCRGTGLFPSVALAQAILESGWGASSLTKKHNNFFGIKAGKSWTGKTVTMRTREEDKSGNSYYVNAVFRAYDSPVDSFRDRANFFKSFSRYKAVLEQTTAQKQIEAIYKAGYATDKKYVSKIMGIIQAQDLHIYDSIMTVFNEAKKKA